MIKIEKFKPEHFLKIKLRDCHSKENINLVSGDLVFTFLFDDEPIAILGGIPILPGVMQLWGLVSDSVKKCPITFHKVVKRMSEEYLKGNYQRLQMTVRSDHPEGSKWARALGFQCEGIMRKYGPDGSDYLMFSKVYL